MGNRFAAISDVHGNIWALRAVLADASSRGAELVVNLGDVLYGPLDPAGTADLLMGLDLPTVHGNEDRILLEKGSRHPAPRSPASGGEPTAHDHLDATLSRLSDHHLAWLRTLPMTTRMDDILLCHGTPEADDEYLLEEIRDGVLAPRPAAEVARRLGGVTQRLVLCGHSHLPQWVNLPDGRLVVNPGSVGCPAFTDDRPKYHRVATGSPHARYALLARTREGWSVEHREVVYDWDAAAARAARHGCEDWARRLCTGQA